jgi:CheY-like chemotaxis protein
LALEFVIANEKLEEAKTSLNKHHFYDVVFLDLEMPILNGYDACAAIKS